MLEGKEIEGKIGNIGSYSVDVDNALNVTIEATISVLEGGIAIKSSNSVSAPLMEIIEKACLKNSITWDESAIAGFKALLKLA
jgi:hypothetical protein